MVLTKIETTPSMTSYGLLLTCVRPVRPSVRAADVSEEFESTFIWFHIDTLHVGPHMGLKAHAIKAYTSDLNSLWRGRMGH